MAGRDEVVGYRIRLVDDRRRLHGICGARDEVIGKFGKGAIAQLLSAFARALLLLGEPLGLALFRSERMLLINVVVDSLEVFGDERGEFVDDTGLGGGSSGTPTSLELWTVELGGSNLGIVGKSRSHGGGRRG